MERVEKKGQSSLLMYFLVFITIVHSCVKDEYRLDEVQVTELSPEFAIPLAYTSMDMWDLTEGIDDGDVLQMQEGSVISLSFEKQLFDLGASDLVQLDEMNLEDDFTADASTALLLNSAPAGTQIPYSEEFIVNMDAGSDVELDSMLFPNALLEIELNSSFRHDIRIEMSIPQLTKDGQSLVHTVELDYQGSIPISHIDQVDIEGYTLDFTTAENPNEFAIQVEMQLTHSGEVTAVGDKIEFNFSLESDQIESIHGYFGQIEVINEPDTQKVEVFETLNADQIYFAEPTIDLRIENGAGIPIHVEFSSLFAPENETYQMITGGALQNIPTIEAAPSMGESSITDHRIDNTNTSPQLSDMISEGPVDLIYSPVGNLNPDGETQNFLSRHSRITCDALINLPLYGFINGYSMSDTLAIDIETDLGLSQEGSLTIDDVTQVIFRIVADNGLPLEAAVQLYFLDSDGLLVDSLFTDQGQDFLLEPALTEQGLPVNHPDQGKVIESARTIIDMPVTQARLEDLTNGDIAFMVVDIQASTGDADSETMIKIFPENAMGISISAKIETNIDLND